MEATTTLNAEQVAELLFADAETVMLIARQGRLPGAKIGKAWVFLREDVLEYLRARIRSETEERARALANSTAPAAIEVSPKARPGRRRAVPSLPPLPASMPR